MGKKAFHEVQKIRILERINRYNDINTVKDQLGNLGELSPYQSYKINVVTKYLHEAIRRIEDGSYGTCVVCGEQISENRLKIVPAALACVACDESRQI